MPKRAYKDICGGYGLAYMSDAIDCLECKKKNKALWQRCKKLTSKLVKDSSLTDEEIEDFLKEKKKWKKTKY